MKVNIHDKGASIIGYQEKTCRNTKALPFNNQFQHSKYILIIFLHKSTSYFMAVWNLQPYNRRFFPAFGRLESDNSAPKQALVKGKQSLVDFKNIVLAVLNEVLHNDIKLIGVA